MLVDKVTGDKGSVPVYRRCHASTVLVVLALNAIFCNILFCTIVRSLRTVIIKKKSGGVLILNCPEHRCMVNTVKSATDEIQCREH